MILWIQVQQQKNLDLITFFPRENAIQTPSELWFEAICASLRLKHSVLVLEKPLAEMPSIDESKRWLSGNNWFSLSPRSLSVISEAYQSGAQSYPDFRNFLRSSK